MNIDLQVIFFYLFFMRESLIMQLYSKVKNRKSCSKGAMALLLSLFKTLNVRSGYCITRSL